jgi:chromosomal replication initiation ATPase DnaA
MGAAAMQLVMPFAPNATYHEADFIRGEANAGALALVERWPDWPYSLVLLHGPQGSGKTHLAHVFASRTGAQFIAPERVGQVPADQILNGGHSWVLDGIEAIADHAALAQLINHARARGDYLLLSARTPATALPIELPDLRSRLLALPTITLGPPDDALLTGVLAKSFADRQLRVTPEVLHYAIGQLERSYASIQRFAAVMDAISLARGRALTLPLVREALKGSAWQEKPEMI